MTDKIKPVLETGKGYKIELYPKKEIVQAVYLGQVEDLHFFENENSYLIVGDHEMIEDGEKITYLNIFSSCIDQLNKQNWRENLIRMGSSNLVRKLDILEGRKN